jgi:UDP-glucose 4-epimerase
MPQKPAQTYLVTGGAGFIGTHLCRALRERGHAVRVLDLRDRRDPRDLGAPSEAIPGVEYVRGDVREPKTVAASLDGAHAVFHLAAIVSIPLCQKDPVESYSTNLTGTLNVLDAIRRRAEREGKPPIAMAFASTAALYGAVGDDGRALKESDTAPSFFSFYAAQKLASEHAMAQYREAYGVPSIAFRFFNVYGEGQDPASPYSGVITTFARLAREKKPLPLNGGGSQTRDFIAVEDIAQALVAALDLPREEWAAQAVNLGSGTRLTIRALAEKIRAAGAPSSEITEAPPREADVRHSMADISRARALLGFAPARSLDAFLASLLK